MADPHTTVVIEPPRAAVKRHRHDETIETWKYAVVYGAFGVVWLASLVAGSYAVESWWIW